MHLLTPYLFHTFINFDNLFTDIVMDIQVVIWGSQVYEHGGLVVTLLLSGMLSTSVRRSYIF
jgi:hypothetical protein